MKFNAPGHVVDKVPRCICRACGEWVTMDTDGHGALLALDDDLTTHPCANP